MAELGMLAWALADRVGVQSPHVGFHSGWQGTESCQCHREFARSEGTNSKCSSLPQLLPYFRCTQKRILTVERQPGSNVQGGEPRQRADLSGRQWE